MLVSEFLTRTSYALRGTDEDAPTFSDDESTYWLSLLNRKKDELYEDVTKNWTLSFSATVPNEVGTVATTGTTTLTGTDTYFTDYRVGDKLTVDGETVRTIDTITSDTVLTVSVAFSNTASAKTFTRQTIIATGVTEYSLHRSLLSPSGDSSTTDGVGSGVYIIDANSNRVNLSIIAPEESNPNNRAVYISGAHPQKLYFTTDVESNETIVGGTLYYPGYFMPADLTAATDVLPFLDPNWAVMAVAAEVAFSDITYESKAPDLNAKANNLYTMMIRKNRGNTYNNPRRIPTNVKRITGTNRY